MERYKMLKIVGDGAYGSVYKALNKNTGEVVAIKKMKKKFTSWEECMSLREIKSLRKLSHPNIVKLKEVIRVNDELHFVFEFMEQNVYQMSKDKPAAMNNDMIKSIIYQTLSGLTYMHKNGFFHRDMKPENLLIQNGLLKIADFGLAREIRSKPPYTDYVSTRWYRAPEILMRSTYYNSPVDIFALGAIMAELYLLRPLFPGSNEHDQMIKVCSILGSPTQQVWPDGHRLASKIGFTFPNFAPVPLQKLIPNAPSEAIDLMMQMMRYDPQKRPTASECLEHPYFYDVGIKSPIKDELIFDTPVKRQVSPVAPHDPSPVQKETKPSRMKDPSEQDDPAPYQPFFPKLPKQAENGSQFVGTSKMFPPMQQFGADANGSMSKPPLVMPTLIKKDPLSFMSEKRMAANYHNSLRYDLPSLGEPRTEFKKPLGLLNNNNYPPVIKKYMTNQFDIDFQQPSAFKPPAYRNPTFLLPLKGLGRPLGQANLSVPPQGRDLLGQ